MYYLKLVNTRRVCPQQIFILKAPDLNTPSTIIHGPPGWHISYKGASFKELLMSWPSDGSAPWISTLYNSFKEMIDECFVDLL